MADSWAAVQAHVSPVQGRAVLGADPGQQAQHDVGVHQRGCPAAQQNARAASPGRPGGRLWTRLAAERTAGQLKGNRYGPYW